MSSFYRTLCLISLMAAVASETWSDAVCFDRLIIAGSENWLSCDHDNTYECNGGKNCCCESGFEPNDGGYCVACGQDEESIGYVAPDGCACIPAVHPDFGQIDSCATDTEFFAWCYVEGQCDKKPSSDLDGKYYAQCVFATSSGTQVPIPTPLPTAVQEFTNVGAGRCADVDGNEVQHIYSGIHITVSRDECEAFCSKDSFCTAYIYFNNIFAVGFDWNVCNLYGPLAQLTYPEGFFAGDSTSVMKPVKGDENVWNIGWTMNFCYLKRSNQQSASKVINYHDCDFVNSVTSGTDDSKQLWRTQCPSNTAVVSVETKTVETDFSWTVTRMKCCGLVDKITDTQDCDRIPENRFDRLEGGGSSSVEDQWVAQCGPDAIMIGIWDNDDSGDFDDIDAAKCCTLDTLYTSGKKIDNDDCAVVNLSANSKFDCPHDYALVGLYDEPETEFRRVRKMKCCRVLESILPTVSPTQMPTTSDPSECPTVSPTTSIPSMSPSTDDPTLYPSQNPTTEQPTNLPSRSPSTEEPSVSPSLRPTFSAPTYYPSTSPSKNPTTETPTVSPTISPSTDPTYYPSTSPSKNPTTETPTVSPTISPSTEQPTKVPSTSPTTEEPSAFPTTEDPSLFPTMSPSTDSPTKFPSRNPTTDNPTAFPSTAPTRAPTICEPTCRSHSDQMVNILGRLLEFNSDLLEKFEQLQTSDDPLKNVLNEMILDFNRLKDQMRKHDRIPFISPAY